MDDAARKKILAHLNKARQAAFKAFEEYEAKKKALYAEHLGPDAHADVVAWEEELIEKEAFARLGMTILEVEKGQRFGNRTYRIQGKDRVIRALLLKTERFFHAVELEGAGR